MSFEGMGMETSHRLPRYSILAGGYFIVAGGYFIVAGGS
jgi:hypothetical protein